MPRPAPQRTANPSAHMVRIHSPEAARPLAHTFGSPWPARAQRRPHRKPGRGVLSTARPNATGKKMSVRTGADATLPEDTAGPLTWDCDTPPFAIFVCAFPRAAGSRLLLTYSKLTHLQS